MVDIFMLVMIIILSILILFINLYLLAYYCTENEENYGTGIITKLIIILGMFIAIGNICLVPLDVSNTAGEGGNFRMDLIWKITYILICSFGFFIIPFAISVYENGPNLTFKQKFGKLFCLYFFKIIIYAGLFISSYLFLAKAKIPMTTLECEFMPNNDNWTNSNEEINDDENIFKFCETKNKAIEISVSFMINFIGVMNIISDIILMFYGGIGLFCLPLDLFYSFCTRPQIISINSPLYEEKREEIVLFAADLKGIGMKLKKSENNGDNKKCICSKERMNYERLLKKFKIGVSLIEEKFEIINMKSLDNRKSAIGYLMNLILGIISLIISIIWIVHIVLYIILKRNEKPFFDILNFILIKLSNINLSFVAIGIFLILSLYLLLITIKGNNKFRTRILCFGETYSLRKNKSYMNSILYNVKLILIASISVVQLSLRSFAEYTSMTDADIIFNILIKNSTINKYIFKYNIFEYGFFAVAFISFIYFIINRDEADKMKKMLYKKHLESILLNKDSEERFIINPGED